MTTVSHDMDLSDILGLTGLSGREQEEMLAQIGSLILESVLLRVVAGMTDEEAAAFESYSATNPEPEAMHDYLIARVPDLPQIFAEEREAFREECVRLFGAKDVPPAV